MSLIQQAFNHTQHEINGFGEYKPHRNPSAMMGARVFWYEYLSNEKLFNSWCEEASEMLADYNGTLDAGCFIPDCLMGDLTVWNSVATDCTVSETLTPTFPIQVLIDYHSSLGKVCPYLLCSPKDLKLRELVIQFYDTVMFGTHEKCLHIIQLIQLRCAELMP